MIYKNSFFFLFRHDINSMVTEKSSSIALVADNNSQRDETLFNFSLIHATTIKFDKLEYDDNIDIDNIDD
jgi:hypothetical protein